MVARLAGLVERAEAVLTICTGSFILQVVMGP